MRRLRGENFESVSRVGCWEYVALYDLYVDWMNVFIFVKSSSCSSSEDSEKSKDKERKRSLWVINVEGTLDACAFLSSTSMESFLTSIFGFSSFPFSPPFGKSFLRCFEYLMKPNSTFWFPKSKLSSRDFYPSLWTFLFHSDSDPFRVASWKAFSQDEIFSAENLAQECFRLHEMKRWRGITFPSSYFRGSQQIKFNVLQKLVTKEPWVLYFAHRVISNTVRDGMSFHSRGLWDTFLKETSENLHPEASLGFSCLLRSFSCRFKKKMNKELCWINKCRFIYTKLVMWMGKLVGFTMIQRRRLVHGQFFGGNQGGTSDAYVCVQSRRWCFSWSELISNSFHVFG